MDATFSGITDSLTVRHVITRFVEMLESHHSLVVKALQKLYKYCVNREGFPGEPLVEAADGNPLTHAILDRLGLIKQAEETLDEPEDPENPQCTGLQSTSGDSSATTDSSSEPRSPPDPPQSSCNTASSSPGLLHDNNYNDNDDILKWDFRLMQPEQYVEYPGFGYNGTMPSRPSFMGTTSLAADAMYPELSPSVPNCEQPYPFYLESSCTRVDLRPGLMSRPGSHAIAAGLPVEIYALGEFQLPFQEQQFYSAPPNTEPFLDSHWNTNNFHQDPNVQQ
ncbi:hypothetical protein MAP00_002661 [Monascus purpureus]|nr:hypothetical protein MAP00_002661 [Monascus purpureus]